MNPLEGISLFTLQETQEEQSYDFHPKTFDDYLGQGELKHKLDVYTKAALMRDEPLDHLLLFGPPGLGKTTLAQIMSEVMKVGIKICNGPMIERTGDLVAILSSLDSKEILFIDEIHRMPTPVEEVLYNAMEHFRVDVIIGQGAGAKSINLPIRPFTLVGATTKAGMISAPLRSRFGITERLDFYNESDLQEIVIQNAKFLKLEMDQEAALLIAKAARGTPRIAKKVLRRVRDFAQVKNLKKVNKEMVLKALGFLGIDDEGLTAVDYAILKILVERAGSAVGLDTLAALIGEDSETIEDVYEPFLMRLGYLEKTPRGRQISNKKLIYLKNKFFGQHTIL